MIIQGLNNMGAIYGAIAKSSAQRQTSPAPSANNADKVTISDAAKSLLSEDVKNNKQADSGVEGPGSRWQAASINNVKEFPGWGEKFTHDFAYDDSYETSGPLVNISNLPTIRYTYTGEVVTDQNLAEFKAQAATVRTGRVALYEAEKAKGTPDAEILEKMFRYTDAQSDGYLNIVGWQRATA